MTMLVVKRTAIGLLKSFAVSLGVALGGFLILSLFIGGTVLYLVSASILLFMLYIHLVTDSVRFEIEADRMRYYRGRRLEKEFQLGRCGMRYAVKGQNAYLSTRDVHLYMVDQEEETDIDCSSIGYDQFQRLIHVLEGQHA